MKWGQALVARVATPCSILLVLAATSLPAAAAPDTREFEFTYRCIIEDLPGDAETVRIWLPVPLTNDDQTIDEFRVDGGQPHEITNEGVYGNAILFAEVPAADAGKLVLGYTCSVTRKEFIPQKKEANGTSKAILERCLEPDRLVPVEGRPTALARTVGAEKATIDGMAKAFYDWILSEMTYDKSGTGWGRGDFAHACDVKTGNCTDFHSYFIGLSRASGIPAIFEMGFPLPPDKTEGKIDGYHCWAKYYDEEHGWSAVDISEADKHPEMAEYYFGRLTRDRVLLARGRDLNLEPRQAGEPLNYFIYPHVEVDGKVIDTFSREVTFRDL